MIKKYFSGSPEQTEKIAEEFAHDLTPGDVVAYRGGMGAGKTAFTRGLAQGMGFTGEVSSPTFALVHEYHGDVFLCHFDMYRVTEPEDLYSTGFFDYLDTNAVLVIEWSENIEEYLPEGTYIVSITTTGENEREIEIDKRKE